MSAVDAALQAKLSQGQGRGERQVDIDEVRKESSKDVQRDRLSELKRRHGLLMGVFGLIMFEIAHTTQFGKTNG